MQRRRKDKIKSVIELDAFPKVHDKIIWVTLIRLYIK